jgi:hypothetical protein
MIPLVRNSLFSFSQFNLTIEMSFAEREFNSTLSAVKGLQQNDGLYFTLNLFI